MNDLPDTIQRVHAEAGGLLELLVFQSTDAPELILDALAGSAEAKQTLRHIKAVVGSVRAAPRRKPMLCAACPRALRGGVFSIVIARPACDDPTRGLGLAICPRCGPDRDTAHAAAAVALRRIWPDLRPVTITHPAGGRA